jgi:predicted NACHT family NTPase
MTKLLRIADIETKEVLFFDAEFREKCFKFCTQRDIEFLPSLDDPSHIYVRDDTAEKFKVEVLSS